MLLHFHYSYIIHHDPSSTRHLIAKIDTLLPYLTMAVSMTGSKMDMSLSSVVSTGRLQRAAHLLSVASVHAASSSGASSRESGVRATTSTTTAAPLSYTPVISLMVRVYTLFIGSVRKSNIQWTWKEQMVKAELMVERRRVVVPADAGEPGRDDISYRLRIMQDLDDGRYHDGNDDDMPQKCTFDVVQIEKMVGRVCVHVCLFVVLGDTPCISRTLLFTSVLLKLGQTSTH